MNNQAGFSSQRSIDSTVKIFTMKRTICYKRCIAINTTERSCDITIIIMMFKIINLILIIVMVWDFLIVIIIMLMITVDYYYYYYYYYCLSNVGLYFSHSYHINRDTNNTRRL